MEYKAVKSIYLNALDVKRPLMGPILQRSEEMRLYDLV
jgi:hypothetical protein